MSVETSLKKIPEWLKGNWQVTSDSNDEYSIVIGADSIQIHCALVSSICQAIYNFDLPKDLISQSAETVQDGDYSVYGNTKGDKGILVKFIGLSPDTMGMDLNASWLTSRINLLTKVGA